MSSALKFSCDSYMYELVQQLVPSSQIPDGLTNGMVNQDKMVEMARAFGLGEQVCVDLIGENTGIAPDRTWKQDAVGEEWRTGDTLNSSIGQGFWRLTPLQLATMTSRLVNGGVAVRPHYILPDVPYAWPKIPVGANNLRQIRDFMTLVTQDNNATAYAARIDIPGFEMGGKTGTAQVAGIRTGEEGRPEACLAQEYRLRDHSLFVGYAPLHNPKYACAVVIEHGCSGSALAAPIARDVLTIAQAKGSAADPLSMPDRPTLREINEAREQAERQQQAEIERLAALEAQSLEEAAAAAAGLPEDFSQTRSDAGSRGGDGQGA